MEVGFKSGETNFRGTVDGGRKGISQIFEKLQKNLLTKEGQKDA